MSNTALMHIHIDPAGVAWIDHTNGKVIEVVVDKLAHGSSVEEMHFQYPYLSLSQIHSALAYYHDHQEELDAEIEQRLKEVERQADENSDSPFRRRLCQVGLGSSFGQRTS